MGKNKKGNSEPCLESAGVSVMFFYRAVSLFCPLAALSPPLSLAPVNHLERAFSASCRLTFAVKEFFFSASANEEEKWVSQSKGNRSLLPLVMIYKEQCLFHFLASNI